nr:uncharacterized protein LOC127330587 [Lolium perenne]
MLFRFRLWSAVHLVCSGTDLASLFSNRSQESSSAPPPSSKANSCSKPWRPGCGMSSSQPAAARCTRDATAASSGATPPGEEGIINAVGGAAIRVLQPETQRLNSDVVVGRGAELQKMAAAPVWPT